MLAPRASSAFVCIRCELKRARPRLPLLARRPPHANFSASARHRDAFDDSSQIQAPPPRGRVSAHPLGRIRKRKGQTVRETTARLGVKTLGDDAEILVLKEVGDAPQEEAVAPEIVPIQQDVPDILASLQQENRPLTLEEITKQLDTLRPKTQAGLHEPHYVTQATFVKLAKVLLQGFTVPQLSHYYSVTKGVEHDHVQKEVLDGLKGSKGTAKRPVERTDWHPGTTQINRRLPGLDVTHRRKKSPVSKQLLVDQILRDVWKLVLLEEIEAPGEIELSLKPWQLSLLSSGASPTPLDQIGRERKAKLEIYWQHDALRITADKNTAEYAADDIERLLHSTETKRLHLRPWTPYLEESRRPSGRLANMFTQKSLQTVSLMTGASVQVAGVDELLIRALNKNTVEDAERSLIRMLPLKTSVSYAIDTSKRDSVKDQSYLLPVDFEKGSLDFLSRELKLGRWSLPVKRASSPRSDPEKRSDADAAKAATEQASLSWDLDPVQARVLERVQQSPESTPLQKNKNKTSLWAAHPEETLSAEFGQVLVPLNNSLVDSDTEGSSLISSPPTFSYTLPGLSRLLTDNTFAQAYHSKVPALDYDFVPAPVQQNFKEGQQYPSLHVQVRHNHTGKPSLRKLTLGFDECVHDVLLPDKAVDIRFRRSHRLLLQAPSADENVRDFMDAVSANIQSGERLTAPALALDIPKWTIPGFSSRDMSGMRTVKYIFTGIRFRQSVVGDLLGTRVAYNTRQSGKLGRKGGALSAYYTNAEGKSGPLEDDERMRGFVQSCFAIADRITEAAANGTPISKTLKPRVETSARKIRRQALQAAVSADEGDGKVVERLVAPVLEDEDNTGELDTDTALTDIDITRQELDQPNSKSIDAAAAPKTISLDTETEEQHSETSQATTPLNDGEVEDPNMSKPLEEQYPPESHSRSDQSTISSADFQEEPAAQHNKRMLKLQA